MVKYIVETTSSLRDLNGNCYHFAVITSTKTKRSLSVNVHGASNAAHILFSLKLVSDWSEIYTTEKWVKIRDFQRINKFDTGRVYEHNVTAKMIRGLNRKATS